ncbi:DUF3784 domain-containing protein [Dyadobacter psychrotolerans]|uniref:DUF3784 domain-containing protein n=1 Tax=Dyadobacter psychrotolerans TaxID=2541721 RepID=A0A4R5DNI9_9BACT|nr:DUF3784 domain-containing protein [Dyadobacter psychrotolerans]TDE13670.1 DUF3784 domain-containing protein [Dyadobacter psychrotolerans]
MIYVAFFLSLVFYSLGFIVTKNNAKYILSGYNTMSETERAKIDIDSYLRFFKRFHIFLGISLFVGTVLIGFFNNNRASMFMTTYPLIAYAWMVFQGKSFYKGSSSQMVISYFVGGILLIIAAVIGFQGSQDYKSSELVLTKDLLEIKGSFGLKIRKDDILNQALVNELPEMSGSFNKINGFAGGDYAKGSFKVKGGKVVRLYVNKKVAPVLWLNTSKGDIYYNADEVSMSELNTKIMRWRGL